MDEQLKNLRVSEIKAGRRHRKDFGDLKSLAQSIKEEGLLQPIGVTADMKLVFGERRLRAVRDVLKRKTILARIVDVSSIVAGEWTENEIRKDFTPSERVAIAKEIEKTMPERRGKSQNIDGFNGRTDDIAAKRAGFGNRQTYRQAMKVVANGSSNLVLAMDQGRVSISAAALLADADAIEQNAVLELDEKAILKAAKEVRQRHTAHRNEQQQAAECKARAKSNGRKLWRITDNQRVVKCDLLLADPPYGISKEPWEPKDLEAFTRDWCGRWSRCDADFIAIFWSQAKLFDGRSWFDESLEGYAFQQILVWHANNNWGPKNRQWFKQTWEPIFLYRKLGTKRTILSKGKEWSGELHNLDCHVAPVPEGNYTGHNLKQHPCQKPVSVMRWLINALTESGEKIVSPFCGVAPCGIAAVQLGRKYLGIEKYAKYRKIAEARIAAYGME